MSNKFYNKESLEAEIKNQEDHPEQYIKIYEDVMRNTSATTAIIHAVAKDTGIYSPKELGDILGKSRSTITLHLNILKEKGFLPNEKYTQEEIFTLLQESEKIYICEWCKNNVPIVEKHHYPIPERQGGIDIVNICPTCHKAFHKLELTVNGGWE